MKLEFIKTVFLLFKQNTFAVFFLFIFVIFSLLSNYFFIFHPQKIKKIYGDLVFHPPQTLKIIEDQLLGNNLKIRVVKKIKRNEIYLDFFSVKGRKSLLINKVVLKGSKEGFFEYWNDSLSLALIDNDGDGILEVVAPTFDHFLRPHVNIVFYNQKTEKFELSKSPLGTSLPQAL